MARIETSPHGRAQAGRESLMERPWADRAHPGNKIRERVRCLGCGKRGCVTHWGRWCFDCNVRRMDYLDGKFEQIATVIRKAEDHG